MEYWSQILVAFILGAASIIAVIVAVSQYGQRQKIKEYGFYWMRYDKMNYVHKYVGKYLYICERTAFLDEKTKNLLEE